MRLFSWFNSSDQVDTVLVCVGIAGAFIEAAVAIAAVINVHKEIEETRKKILEKYIEIFACIAAFFFLAEAILGWRSSMLLGQGLEKLKTDNLELRIKLQPRAITLKQETNFISLCAHLRKMPIKVIVGMADDETIEFSQDVRQALDAAGFACPENGYIRDNTLAVVRAIGANDDSKMWMVKRDTNVTVNPGEILSVRGSILFTNKDGTIITQWPGGFDAIVIVSEVSASFEAVGIHSTWSGANTDQYLNPGEAAFFIPEKIH